jgi:hypothetical protein
VIASKFMKCVFSFKVQVRLNVRCVQVIIVSFGIYTSNCDKYLYSLCSARKSLTNIKKKTTAPNKMCRQGEGNECAGRHTHTHTHKHTHTHIQTRAILMCPNSSSVSPDPHNTNYQPQAQAH